MLTSIYALGISRFLTNDLGLIPEKQFITDNTPLEYQNTIAAQFDNFTDDIAAETVFSNDGGFVEDQLRRIKFRSRPLILGSALDRVVAKELKTYQLSVSTPISESYGIEQVICRVRWRAAFDRGCLLCIVG